MYQNLSGRDLDQWAETRGIKRYQGFLFPDSDEKFKEEIAKNFAIEVKPSSQYILLKDYEGYRGRLVVVDKDGDFLFEKDPSWEYDGCFFDFNSRSSAFKEKFPELKNSLFFWICRENSKWLGEYESEYLKIDKTEINTIGF
jgi:hypothetical protein